MVYWRSLRNAPPVGEWLGGAIAALSAGKALVPDGFDAQLGLLLKLARACRGLLVLDNLEAILEPSALGVRYQAGYAGYGMVLAPAGRERAPMLPAADQPREAAAAG